LNSVIKCTLSCALGVIPLVAFGVVPDFDSHRAFECLEAQCGFGPRPPNTEAHRACANWLYESLTPLADEVELQHYSYITKFSGDTLKLVNIIARFQPQHRDRIVIGAHWDTRPVAENDPYPNNRNKPIPGANDGASGVAVILELARLFSEYPPPVAVELVLFDGEDFGQHGSMDDWCTGSRYYGMRLTGELPRWGIVLDMIGEKDAVYSMEVNSLDLAPRLARTLWNLAQELNLICFDPTPGPTVWDDHIMLNQNGIPSVDIIDFDYPFWHTLEDTPDKCSPESLGNVGTLMVHWIYNGAQVNP
jgi:glutaminyl-peptide cyclotransferase